MNRQEEFMKGAAVANLQVKGVDDDLYEALKGVAASAHRSVSQQVVLMLRDYLVKGSALAHAKSPADILLELAGSWEDDRPVDVIAADLLQARRSSTRLKEGW